MFLFGFGFCGFFALAGWFTLVVGVLWIACGRLLYVLFVSGLLFLLIVLVSLLEFSFVSIYC